MGILIIFLGYELYDENFNEIKNLDNPTWWNEPDVYFSTQRVGENWGKNEFKFKIPKGVKFISVYIVRYDPKAKSIFVDNATLKTVGSSINLLKDGNFSLPRDVSIWETSELQGTYGNPNSMLQNYLFKDRVPALSILANAKKLVDNELSKNESVQIILPVSKPSEKTSLTSYETIVSKYFDDLELRFKEWKNITGNKAVNIEVAGIYYAQESPVVSDIASLKILKNLIHNKGWKFFVSPYNNPTSRNSIGPKGFSPEVFDLFDVVWQQPNVFFRDKDIDGDGIGENIDLEMLNWIFTEVGKSNNFGINMENRKINIKENEPYGRILDYIDYGYKYGFVNTTHCYFDDQGAHYINSNSNNPLLRQDYDALYDFIKKSRIGKIINGDFEMVRSDNSQLFYNWKGDYSVGFEPLYTANDIKRLSNFTNNASTKKIPVNPESKYSINFRVNESVKQSQYSALYGFKFFDKNDVEIISTNGDYLCSITPDCANNDIRYSSYLGKWYQYINPKDVPTNFSFNFDIPSNAVSVELFFNRWGNGYNITWDSINLINNNSNKITHFYYYENNQKLYGAYGDFGNYNIISFSKGGKAITQEKVPLIGDATYEIEYATKEALPSNCNGFDSLLGFEFYDQSGKKIEGKPITGLTWSSYLGVYYYYTKSSHIWSNHKIQFITPENAVSTKLLIQNWNCDGTVYFDNINLNLIENGLKIIPKHNYGWKNGLNKRNILNINNWNTNFPLISVANDKPSYYKSVIDVSCRKDYTFSTLVKESLNDNSTNSALLGIEIFDENLNLITGKEVEMPGLIWSEFYQLWYYYINVQNQNVDPFYLNNWQNWTRNFKLPDHAAMMRLGLYNWSPNIENIIFFQRPMLFDNDISICENALKTSDKIPNEIELKNSNPNLKLYPNPSYENVILSFKNPRTNKLRITINDLSGRIIRKYNYINSNEIELSVDNLTKGMYIVTLRDLVENKTYSKKFILK